MGSSKRITRAATAAAAVALLAGCAIGPDFKRPDAPAVSGYSRTPLPAETAAADVAGGKAQRFVIGQDITSQWWTLFQSPQLNNLMAQVLENSPDVDEAGALLRQAEETLKAQQSILFPSVDGNLDARRQKSYGNFGGGTAVSFPADRRHGKVSRL